MNVETENFIAAAQDQNILKGMYQSRIFKNGADSKCKLCANYKETIGQLISRC